MQLQNRMEEAAASDAESAALVLLRDNALKERFVQCVREQSARQVRWIAYHSVDKSFHHMRDEALHLLQENDEHHHTMRIREAEVGEGCCRDEQVPVHHIRGQGMGSPSQMIQTHQQLQPQVTQLGSQQNEMVHQLRAVLDKFPQGHVARPISVPANIP